MPLPTASRRFAARCKRTPPAPCWYRPEPAHWRSWRLPAAPKAGRCDAGQRTKPATVSRATVYSCSGASALGGPIRRRGAMLRAKYSHTLWPPRSGRGNRPIHAALSAFATTPVIAAAIAADANRRRRRRWQPASAARHRRSLGCRSAAAKQTPTTTVGRSSRRRARRHSRRHAGAGRPLSPCCAT